MTSRSPEELNSIDSHDLRPFVIGTAGHVDHGKSTLVQRLTGIDPDRLTEEKVRHMTIDLGFAWLDLPSNRRVGIVDVPGHERFIRNMLAGIGGIDAALLVIAADEGPMPQTREHLAILDLLGVDKAVVVATKSDLVDADWVAIVEEEINELLAPTSLAGSPILPVSSTTGSGIDNLIAAIDAISFERGQLESAGPPRMPIDRAFTLKGFGSVVTGTIVSGSFSAGQDVVLMPDGRATRIRGIQAHGVSINEVIAGNRAAINISGVDKSEIRRGDTLTIRDALPASLRLDAFVRILASADKGLRQNDDIDLFLGSSEVPGQVTLLNSEEIEPGHEGWVQLRLSKPVSALRNDRIVLRRLSPGETIGGGSVVDPNPPRHKRFRPEVISLLETLALGDPQELILQSLSLKPSSVDDLIGQIGSVRSSDEIAGMLTELERQESILKLGGAGQTKSGRWISRTSWDALSQSIAAMLGTYHRDFPERAGMPREELRRRTALDSDTFDQVIEFGTRRNNWITEDALVRSSAFSITLSDTERTAADTYLDLVRNSGFSPPAPDPERMTPQLLSALVARNELVRVAEGMYFEPATLDEIETKVLEIIDTSGSISLSEFRDAFETSRKYAQAVLEYLDRQRVTRRVGDNRRRFGRSMSAS